LARTVVLGRRSNNPRGPVSIGEPRIVLRTAADLRSTAFGMTPWDYHSKIKDFFWYIEKWQEGKANILTNQALLKHADTLSRIQANFPGGNVLAKGKTLVIAVLAFMHAAHTSVDARSSKTKYCCLVH
jgi:hypothetical protein